MTSTDRRLRQDRIGTPPCDAAGVDSSVPAIELARRNAALNGLSEDACAFQQQDIMKFMQAAAAEGATYNLIILDPPKLAPNRKSLQRAARR